MRPKPPTNLQQVWQLYNRTEAFLSCLWHTHQDDFLKYYFPEIAQDPPETEPMASDYGGLGDDDEIPF